MKKKELKENPIMVDKKNIKNKKFSKVSTNEDEHLIRNFVILVAIIMIIIGIVYGISVWTKKDKNDTTKENETIAGEINYDIVAVGTILNRNYNDYYVLIYDGSKPEALKYSTILSKYMQKKTEDGYVKIFYCDLGDEINKAYYNVGEDNKSNPKAKTTSDFDFGDLTLLRIKKGKIVEYIEDYDKIQEKLK